LSSDRLEGDGLRDILLGVAERVCGQSREGKADDVGRRSVIMNQIVQVIYFGELAERTLLRIVSRNSVVR